MERNRDFLGLVRTLEDASMDSATKADVAGALRRLGNNADDSATKVNVAGALRRLRPSWRRARFPRWWRCCEKAR
jgi:hypothetical protein